MQPNTKEDWLDVANERQKDARAALARQRKVMAVYLAGYGIECTLKAYLQACGKPRPKGAAGHDLGSLWKGCHFQYGQIADTSGQMSYFLEGWSTDLRYERTLPTEHSAEELVTASGRLMSWIKRQMLKLGRRR